MATDIFSRIEGLVLGKEDLLEAELFAQQYLEDAFPSYDFRQGTSLRDMTVRPNALILALINKALKNYYDESDVLNMTNATDNDLVDRKLSNLFITRRMGTKAVISTRLYFTFPAGNPATLSIPSSAYFSTDNILKYYPESTTVVRPITDTPIEGNYYFKYDSGEGMWYVDIPMKAEVPSNDYNLEDGELLYFTLFSPYFIRGIVLSLVETAITAESNTDMVKRAYTSISTRNLINIPSIEARLLDNFNFIRNVYVVGLGNDYLYRDLIDVADAVDPQIIRTYHRGSMVDVLVDTDIAVSKVQLTTDGDGRIYLSGPIYQISRATGPTSDTIEIDSEYTVSIENSTTYDEDSVPSDPELDVGLSSRQRTVIEFSATDTYQTATFDLKVFTGLNSIQEYFNSDKNRVVVADYLARTFEPVFIDVHINTHGAAPDISKNAGKEVIASVRTSVQEYIRSIPNGGTLYVSSIIDAIISSGHTDIVMPITVSATLFNRNMEEAPTATIVDKSTILPIRKFRVGTITMETSP